MGRRTLHAVVFQEDGMWIAQCLEVNLVSCAETVEALPDVLMRQLLAQMRADERAGRQPFEKFKKAPEKYWRLYEEVKASGRAIEPRRTIGQRLRELLSPPPVRTQLVRAEAL